MPNTWLEISKSALLSNIDNFKKIAPPKTKQIAIVKANAYGHGLIEVAKIIQDEVDYLAVSNIDEARKLRQNDITRNIIVLGYFDLNSQTIDWANQERVELTISDFNQAQLLSKISHNRDIRAHIKIDTGLGRLGIRKEFACGEIIKINQLPNILIKGIYTHIADAIDHKEYAATQLESFVEIKNQLSKSGLDYPIFHIAKTEALLLMPQTALDAVRLGIGIYGLWPNKKIINEAKNTSPNLNLKPAMTWKSLVWQVKDYPEGEYIGYGCSHKTRRKTKIAIIPVGYSEGYDRRLSNKGFVLLKGNKVPVIGRICMNMTIIDITDIQDNINPGDEVVLMGAQGNFETTADDISQEIGTINHEIISRINPNLKRIIID